MHALIGYISDEYNAHLIILRIDLNIVQELDAVEILAWEMQLKEEN